MEDERVKPGICGVTRLGGTGIEWICVRPVHAKVYKRKDGRTFFSENYTADQHYFVRRYPNRSIDGAVPSPTEGG